MAADFRQLLADTYRQNGGLLQMHLGDLTDADLLVRPTEKANHAAWQLGHLTISTANLINMATPGAVPAPSAEMAARYNRANASSNTGFDTKEQLVNQFNQVNEQAVAWLNKLSDADLAKPMPDAIKALAATVGHLTQVLPGHVMMHIGQIQVLRRKLGKPVLF